MELSPALASYVTHTYRNSYYDAPLAGMQRAQATALKASTRLAQGELTPRNLVELQGAQYAFKANAIVLKTISNMQGTLLNALA